MSGKSTMPEFRLGCRDSIPFTLVIGPFGMLFGVLAVEAGLSVVEALTFSAVVVAGAAQLTAIQLMTEQAPTAVVLLSALAVNLRMAMYSAALTPALGDAPVWKRAIAAYCIVDQSYACASSRFERERGWSVRQRYAYFFGTMAPMFPAWYAATLAGAIVGESIPEAYALDFALPITFVSIVAPMLRTRAHQTAALTAVVAALCLSELTWNLGLPIAGLLGMAAGAEVDRRAARRAQA